MLCMRATSPRASPAMNAPIDPLDELLSRYAPPPAPPANLAGKIRRRLAAPIANTRPAWWERLDTVFARPSFATTFVAACVLLGLFLAEARLSRWHAARGAQMARSYVELIDPLLEIDSSPPPATRAP